MFFLWKSWVNRDFVFFLLVISYHNNLFTEFYSLLYRISHLLQLEWNFYDLQEWSFPQWMHFILVNIWHNMMLLKCKNIQLFQGDRFTSICIQSDTKSLNLQLKFWLIKKHFTEFYSQLIKKFYYSNEILTTAII